MSRKLTLIVQAATFGPWAVKALMAFRGLTGDVRWWRRPDIMGDMIEIEMLMWSHRPIMDELPVQRSKSLRALISMITVLVKRSYGVQLILADDGSDQVEEVFDAAPGDLYGLIPFVLERRNTMILIRDAKAFEAN